MQILSNFNAALKSQRQEYPELFQAAVSENTKIQGTIITCKFDIVLVFYIIAVSRSSAKCRQNLKDGPGTERAARG